MQHHHPCVFDERQWVFLALFNTLRLANQDLLTMLSNNKS
jgi:hypothetical protein